MVNFSEPFIKEMDLGQSEFNTNAEMWDFNKAVSGIGIGAFHTAWGDGGFPTPSLLVLYGHCLHLGVFTVGHRDRTCYWSVCVLQSLMLK